MIDPFARPTHLHVYWSQRALTHALAMSGATGCVQLEGHTTFADMFRVLGNPQQPGDTYASPLLGRLLVREAIACTEGPWRAHAHDPWTVKAIHRALGELRAAGVTSQHLARVPSPPLAALMHVLAAYESALHAAHVYDDADRERAAVLAVIQGPLPPAWSDVQAVTVEGGAGFLGARLDLLNAFAHRGMAVTLRIPWDAQRPDAFLWPEASLHALETRGHPALRVEYDARMASSIVPHVVAIPEGAEHGRYIANAVARWISGGMRPDQICIASPDVDGVGAHVVRQLHALGIPTAHYGSTALTSTPIGRLLSSLLTLRDEGVHREDLIDILMALPAGARARMTSHASDETFRDSQAPCDIDHGSATQTAYVMRCAGVRSAHVGGVREPLIAYGEHHRNGRVKGATHRIAEQITHLLAALDALPAQAPLHVHVHAFTSLLQTLGIGSDSNPATPADNLVRERLEAQWDRDGSHLDNLWRSEAHAMRAQESVVDMLGRLHLAATCLHQASAHGVWSRHEVAQWIHLVLQEARLPAAAVRLGAVSVCALEDVVECSYDGLVLAGINGGCFPRAIEQDPILTEAMRIEINRALGPRLMQTSATTGRGRVGADARDRWLWTEALACAKQQMLVTYSTQQGDDAHGRSEFVEELLAEDEDDTSSRWRPSYAIPAACVASIEATASSWHTASSGAAAHAIVPPFVAGMSQWIQAWSLAHVAQKRCGLWHDVDGVLQAICPSTRASVVHRVAHARQTQSAKEMVRLPDGDTRLLESYFAHVVHSPSKLNFLGVCAYRYFAHALLALHRDRAPALGADAREQGTLAHAALEHVYRDILSQAGVTPQMSLTEVYSHNAFAKARRHPDATLQRAYSVLDAYRTELFRHVAIHPLLQDVVFDDVWRTVQIQLKADLDTDATYEPLALEYGFGEASGVHADGTRAVSAPPLHVADPTGMRSLVIRGKIDRIDRMSDGVQALDYKRTTPTVASGRHFQLPIYAAVAARDMGDIGQHAQTANVSAAWIVLDSAKRKQPPLDDATHAIPMSALKAHLWQRVERVLGGDVSPDPALPATDCTRCDYRHLCRVPGTAPDDIEGYHDPDGT